jgi:hypothetical protein
VIGRQYGRLCLHCAQVIFNHTHGDRGQQNAKKMTASPRSSSNARRCLANTN